jgi:hypothetical protein
MYGQRVSLATSAMEEPRKLFSWRQEVVLKAAAQAECIEFRHHFRDITGQIPYGVYRSLVIKGYLRHHPLGFAITDDGRRIVERVL